MNQQTQMVTFHVTCPESRVWLVLVSDNHEPYVIKMHQTHPDHWFASAAVRPGEYQCRYYGGDERRVIYYGAATIEGSIEQGMDALLSIAVADEQNASAFAQSAAA